VRRALLLFALVPALIVSAVALGVAQTYRVHTVAGYGISLSLPSSWKAVDSRHLLTRAQLQATAKDNPELVGALAAISNPNSPVKFFAFDPLATGNFATNANVVVIPIPRAISFDAFQKALVAELTGLSTVSGLKVTRTTLPAGRAVRASYRLRIATGGRSFQTATLQYGFLRGSRGYVVTYTTLPSLQSLYANVFATSAASIRFSG